MKRQNLKSGFAFALLLALVLPILAACGGATPAATTATNPPAAATAAGAAEAPTAAGAAEAPTVAAAEQPTAEAATGEGNVLRVGSGTFPDILDPQDSQIVNEIEVLQLVYEGLTRFDKDLKTVPGAAEKWEPNADATEFTFHLRDGLKYSDGSPLVAQDYVDAIRRSLDPRGTVGGYQATYFMIKGADAILNTEIPTDEAKVPELFNSLGVTAPDEKTVKFELTQPTPYFPTLVGIWVAYPAKQSMIDEGGELWWEDPTKHLGNGPFKFKSIDKGQNLIELEATDTYWQGKPKISGVRFQYIGDLAVQLQAYKNNELDIATIDPNDIPAIKGDPVLSKEYKEYPGSCTTVIAFNLKQAPFDNQKVREAFAYAFDRDSYINDALKGSDIKTLTWIPKGYPGYDPSETRFDYDPAKAKQLLTEAGFPDGQGLPEIKYTYNSTNPANQGRFEFVNQMYQKNLGITLSPDPQEGKTLSANRKTNETYPQMYNGEGWCADYPDPQNWLSIYWHSRSEFAQKFGYSNPEVDKLTDQADIEVDATKRADLYSQAQKLVIGDSPVVFRSNTKNDFLIKPNITGLDFTAQDSGFLPGGVTGLLNVTIKR
jgi:oligopeptide transport system substrate-binding protein